MKANGVTFDMIETAAQTFHLVCVADGVDDQEIFNDLLNLGYRDNRVYALQPDHRQQMVADHQITPAALAILEMMMTMGDVETLYCMATLAIRR